MATALEVWFDLRSPTWTHRPVREIYKTAIDICEWADDVGFQGVTVGEHHCAEDNYSASPVVTAGVIGGRTKKLNLRMIILSPFYNLLKLAEDLAVLNLHTDGRALPVISGGYRPAEFDMFGIRVDDRANVMEEAVDLLRSAWTGEPFRCRGRDIKLLSPVPDPKPRLLLGASSPKMARLAAAKADGLSPAEARIYELFRQERLRLGKGEPMPYPNPGTDFMFISENPEKAWEDLFPYWTHGAKMYGQWAAEAGIEVNTRFPLAKTVDELKALPTFRVFTPEECVEYAHSLGENGQLNFQPLAGGMAPELAWSSLKLFEKKVLPHLDVKFVPNLLY